MKKTIISLAVAAFFAFSFVACQPKAQEEEVTPDEMEQMDEQAEPEEDVADAGIEVDEDINEEIQ